MRSVATRLETVDLAELEPLLDSVSGAGNPWRPLALELKGVLAVKTGDVAAAREIPSACMNERLISWTNAWLAAICA